MATPELNRALNGTPDHVIGETRIQTVPEVRYFRVTGHAPLDKLDEILDPLIVKLEVAQAAAGIAAAGPLIIRYFQAEQPGIFRMDVGVQVTADVTPAGDAQVETLPSLRCASLLYWGGLMHVGDAYGALNRAIAAAGLISRGENREWWLHFEGDNSTNIVILLQMEVVAA